MTCAYLISRSNPRHKHLPKTTTNNLLIVFLFWYYPSSLSLSLLCAKWPVSHNWCYKINAWKPIVVWPQIPSQPLPLQNKTSMVKLAIASLFLALPPSPPLPWARHPPPWTPSLLLTFLETLLPLDSSTLSALLRRLMRRLSNATVKSWGNTRLGCHACSYWIP